ncbi:MAG: T9SS type A sorting domain-containing protein, partial [Fimbriimonadaceae bacterium]|nr:T9SS type A sorting domain-containing protein [Chitinophagales bacterium]
MKSIAQNLFTICFIFSSVNIFAQAPDIEWQNTIGSNNYDFLNAIGQTSDGGYIMGGYSIGAISGDKTEGEIGVDDYWIVKINAAGTVEWENTIGGYNYDKFYSIEETPDGGYIIGGHSLSGGGADKSEGNMFGYDYWVVKVSAIGVVEWDNTIGGTGNDMLYNVQPTSDGGYILAGNTDSGISGDKTEARVGNTDYWVIKLDEDGNIVWQNDIGGVMFDYLFSAYETADGGYILGGYSTSGISGDKTEANIGFNDYWIVKLDEDGLVEWDNTIGGTGTEYLYSLIPTADGGYIAAGISDSGISGDKTEASSGNDYWIVKLDEDGNITWQNTIGGSGSDLLFVNPVDQTADGGYILGGYSQSGISGDKTEANTGSWDNWILKLDDTGNITWQTVLGGSSGDYANAVEETADGGYIIGGFSYSGISGEKTEANIGDADYWVIKLEGTGCFPFTETCNGLDDDCDFAVDEDITETISISAAGATTFCQTGSVVLNATHTGTSLQWKKNGVNIPGATSSSYTATTKGNYTCETSSSCNTALSSAIFVNVIKNPAAAITAGGPTSFCTGGAVVLTANAGAGLSYQWYKGATALIGATSINYTATVAGNYKCRVTKTATGCFKNSNKIIVTVPCREANDLTEAAFSIYPNPAKDYFIIEFNAGELNNAEIKITITNILGEAIYTERSNLISGKLNKTIPLNNNIPAGVYTVQITSEKNIISKNI